ATESNDSTSVAKSQLLLAKAYSIIGNYALAVDYLEQSQTIFSSLTDTLNLVETHQVYGQIYTRIGEFKKALDNTEIAFTLAGKLKLRDKIAELTRETGNIYFYFNEKTIALDFYQKSLKISEEYNNNDGIAKAYNNMGRIYSETGNYNLALECLKKSLSYKSKENDKVSYGNTLLNIGTVYLAQQKFEEALTFFGQSFESFSSVSNAEGMANSLYYSGQTYLLKNQFNQALASQDEAWRIASETESKRLQVRISLALSEIHAKVGDFKRAYSYFKIHSNLRDSVFSDENTKLILELETRYQLHAKQRQIELLSKEQALKQSEQRKARIWIALLAIVTLFLISLSYFIYLRFRDKNKHNKQLLEEIQQRKEIEQKLNDYKEHLENLVDERTWELKIAKDRAEEADRLKTAFLTNMSHEIRTPMNAIVGFSYLLTDPDSSEESKAEYYNIIKSNGEVLMNLINDILDISMIESGQLKTRNKAANIGNIVRELLTHYNQTKDELKKKKLTITLDIEETDSSLTVKTDPVRLRQVLSNLLSNSLKFTNEGRICFGYRLSDSKEIIFFVRDTGCGIDPKNHRAIFERFNKFGNASDAKLYTGSGLGLAISHELVNLLGGKIWLDSFPGKGSTFYFTIPYIPEKVKKVPDDHLDQNTFYERITNKTILVAEDVLSNFQLIQAFLSSAKVNILWAQNGVEAIDIFTKNRNIDIILMDVQMPIMDGLKALKRIRELDKKVPIIVNSAFYMPDEMEKSFTAGCSDYMTKPIKKEDLISKLSGFLS
ncbi:MAG TPA: tetratricopeptide repeat protein, partial [Tenuifilaceae bacterium]|nr:tetratricopeptide repeat protein [Tenuifilaceae bacterium]